MSTLERAIEIAANCHAGQTDKGDQPYILHPLRVMMSLDSRDTRIAAVLHDTVEDGDWTLRGLSEEGFDPQVIAAIDALTHRDGETYMDYVRRAAADPIAAAVKRADLADNLDLSRIPAPARKDLDRADKYRRALALIDELTSGS